MDHPWLDYKRTLREYAWDHGCLVMVDDARGMHVATVDCEPDTSQATFSQHFTRHGMVHASAAAAAPPATDTRAPTADAAADMRPPGPVPGRQYRAMEQRSGTVRIHLGASHRKSRQRRHRSQFEITIADCGPRVPSSGSFVRLPAPETLHGSGPSASGGQNAIADIERGGINVSN